MENMDLRGKKVMLVTDTHIDLSSWHNKGAVQVLLLCVGDSMSLVDLAQNCLDDAGIPGEARLCSSELGALEDNWIGFSPDLVLLAGADPCERKWARLRARTDTQDLVLLRRGAIHVPDPFVFSVPAPRSLLLSTLFLCGVLFLALLETGQRSAYVGAENVYLLLGAFLGIMILLSRLWQRLVLPTLFFSSTIFFLLLLL